MYRAHKVLLVLGMTIFGVWGCSKGTPGVASTVDRTGALEAKVTTLETELKLMTAARDVFKTKLTTLENQLKTEIARSGSLQTERDDSRVKLLAKTQERDQLNTQFESFRKNLKDLIGQTELTSSPTPTLSANPAGL